MPYRIDWWLIHILPKEIFIKVNWVTLNKHISQKPKFLQKDIRRLIKKSWPLTIITSSGLLDFSYVRKINIQPDQQYILLFVFFALYTKANIVSIL